MRKSKIVASRRFLPVALCTLLCGGAVVAAPPDGYVVRVESATVYLDWGTPTGVKPSDRFDVYREGAALKHPVTGEVLGKTEEKLGAGSLQTVEPKFSIGHLDAASSNVHIGDRTRWQTPIGVLPEPSTPPAAAAVNPPTSLTPAITSPQELWRSEPLEKDAVGLAFADLDGDGKKDILIAYRKKIVAYHLKDKKLEPFATFDNRKYRRWLTIDTADLKHDGHEEIFATVFLGGLDRPHIIVLRYENGNLNQVGNIEGFARSIQKADGSRHLYWQNLSHSQDVSYTAPCELTWENSKYKPGSPVDLKLSNDQLFGFGWGNWYANSPENLAVLEHGERIRVFSPDVKWKSSEVFGGTKNDFPIGENKMGAVYPRLFAARSAGADRDQLLVPTNISDFGVRMTYLKIFHKSEIEGLVWNGLEMRAVWRLSIEGYLPDYGLADLLELSRPQLWTAVVGPGDKTILLGYALP